MGCSLGDNAEGGMSENQNIYGTTNKAYADELAALDMKPRELRDVLKRAPFAYGMRNIDNFLKEYCNDVRAARAALIRAIVDDVVFKTIKTYGKDHPQANIKAWLK
jgi:hypothetical protein